MEKIENNIENIYNAKLLNPSIDYKNSYIEAMKEFLAEGGKNADVVEERITEQDLNNLENDFEGFLNQIIDKEKGINLQKGYSPASTLWLINNKEFIGRISIRHRLNEEFAREIGHIGYMIRPSKRGMGYGNEILKLGLEEAKKLGIPKVLLLVDKNNMGSIKVIEKNGGIFENEKEENGKVIRRYWIDVK